jgi:hypothetical protein
MAFIIVCMIREQKQLLQLWPFYGRLVAFLDFIPSA